MPNTELEQLKIQKEQLELERLQEEIAQLRAKRQRQTAAHEQVEKDLADYKAQIELGQKLCNHRKGGRGLEGLRGAGSDAMYAVIQHQFPTGKVGVLCLRCQKMWMPGDAEYHQALAYPTDNTPSGAAQFRIEKL